MKTGDQQSPCHTCCVSWVGVCTQPVLPSVGSLPCSLAAACCPREESAFQRFRQLCLLLDVVNPPEL